MRLNVRKARLVDIKLIEAFHKQLLAQQMAVIKSQLPQHSGDFKVNNMALPVFRQFIKSMIYSRNGLVLVAEVDNLPAGYALLFIKKNVPIFKLKKIGELTDLFILKRFRGQGLSSLLKKEAFDKKKKKGVKKVSLNIFIQNEPAFSIYKKWRFTPFLTEMRARVS